MPIDTSMYKNSVQFDPMSAYAKGLNMKQLANQSEMQEQEMAEKKKLLTEEKASKGAYKQNITTGADGAPVLDENKYLSDLAQINPEKAIEEKRRLDKQGLDDSTSKIETHLKHLKAGSQIIGSATDQPTWDAARGELIKHGLMDEKSAPRQYDPNWQKSAMYRSMTGIERIEQQNKDREFGLKQQELGIKRQEAASKQNNGEHMAIDKKKFVETLATKNANKTAIKNQIDAVTSQWDSLSEDQKYSLGGQLLKTLNSPEGADAIGAEEAKRLGARLQFSMGNFTNSNPTQFGRDLKGFKEQAENTSKTLGASLVANQGEVDRAMGRQSNKTAPPAAPPKVVMQNGHSYTFNPATGKYE